MPFASSNDIAVRLETSFAASGVAAANALITTASAVICEAAEQPDEDWYGDLSTSRKALVKGICIELVCRAMASPQGLASASETLGQYTRSEQYRRDLSTALLLTDGEERLIRDLVHGQTSGSSSPESIVDRVLDLVEGYEVDHPGS